MARERYASVRPYTLRNTWVGNRVGRVKGTGPRSEGGLTWRIVSDVCRRIEFARHEVAQNRQNTKQLCSRYTESMHACWLRQKGIARAPRERGKLCRRLRRTEPQPEAAPVRRTPTTSAQGRGAVGGEQEGERVECAAGSSRPERESCACFQDPTD